MGNDAAEAHYEVAILARERVASGLGFVLCLGLALCCGVGIWSGAHESFPQLLAVTPVLALFGLIFLYSAFRRGFVGRVTVAEDVLTVYEGGKPVLRCNLASIASLHHGVEKIKVGTRLATIYNLKIKFTDGTQKNLFRYSTERPEELQSATRLVIGSWEAWKAGRPQVTPPRPCIGPLDSP